MSFKINTITLLYSIILYKMFDYIHQSFLNNGRNQLYFEDSNRC